MLGRKAWFGPRRMGWGLSPVSPEGWAATLMGAAGAVCVAALTRNKWWISLAVVAALLLVVFLKGTSPGGPREWQEYRAQQERGDT